MKALLSAVIVLLFGISDAYAYIDPGTGATFVGSLGPLLLAACSGIVAVFLKVFWHPLRALFFRAPLSTKGQLGSAVAEGDDPTES